MTERSKPILAVQHAKSETLGVIGDALRSASKRIQTVRTFEGQPVPTDPNEFSALVIMGGPMSVYETGRNPFLVQEMKLIERFFKARLPVLGVCLGSQLLAASLGATVKKGHRKEIGWHPVKLSAEGSRDLLCRDLPSQFVAYHWHGDAYELPKDTTLLASSEITPVQAFRYDEQVYGVLFHLEVTESHVRDMLSEFAAEIQQENLSADEIMKESRVHLPELQRLGMIVFSEWASLI